MKKSKPGTLTLEEMGKIYETSLKADDQSLTTSRFSHDQLLEALYWVWDFMERASIHFYCIGTIADSVRDKKDLYGDKITVAVRKNEWDSGARRIADAFAPPLKDEGSVVEYEYKGVPITLYVLEDHTTLVNADTTIYNSEYFQIPNPYPLFKEVYSWLPL